MHATEQQRLEGIVSKKRVARRYTRAAARWTG